MVVDLDSGGGLRLNKMTRNEGEQLVTVVIASPESDEYQPDTPDMSRDMKIDAAIQMVQAGGVRGTVARHFGLSRCQVALK